MKLKSSHLAQRREAGRLGGRPRARYGISVSGRIVSRHMTRDAAHAAILALLASVEVVELPCPQQY